MQKKRFWLQKENMTDHCSDRNVLYLDCININILVVILYYCFARCHHERKLGKGYSGSLCIISYKRMWYIFYTFLRIKKQFKKPIVLLLAQWMLIESIKFVPHWGLFLLFCSGCIRRKRILLFLSCNLVNLFQVVLITCYLFAPHMHM